MLNFFYLLCTSEFFFSFIVHVSACEWSCEYSAFQDLISEFKSELTSDLEQTVVALMMTPVEYDADQIYRALSVVDQFLLSINWFLISV